MRVILIVLFAGLALLSMGRAEASGPVRDWLKSHRPGLIIPKRSQCESAIIHHPVEVTSPAVPSVSPFCPDGRCPLQGR